MSRGVGVGLVIIILFFPSIVLFCLTVISIELGEYPTHEFSPAVMIGTGHGVEVGKM